MMNVFNGKRAFDQIKRDGSIKAAIVSVMADLILKFDGLQERNAFECFIIH